MHGHFEDDKYSTHLKWTEHMILSSHFIGIGYIYTRVMSSLAAATFVVVIILIQTLIVGWEPLCGKQVSEIGFHTV